MPILVCPAVMPGQIAPPGLADVMPGIVNATADAADFARKSLRLMAHGRLPDVVFIGVQFC